jgi:uncharacterized small protein (DUF1192 family)
MFCVLHQFCSKSVANGHCTVFTEEGVRHKNERVGNPSLRCSVAEIPEDRIALRKQEKARNALKESKRKAAGK